jgi:Fe-S oxidoreductase
MNEVVLFPTCLAEEFFPEARDAAIAVIERLRVKVRTMPRAFCCGQAALTKAFAQKPKNSRGDSSKHASRERRS